MKSKHEECLVQVHDLPFVCMSYEVGLQIGNTIGKVVDVDVQEDEVGWGSYL